MESRKSSGFLASLKGELIRTLSPSPSRARGDPHFPFTAYHKKLLLTASDNRHNRHHSAYRYGAGVVETLAPLMEGPDPDGDEPGGGGGGYGGLGKWVKGQILRLPSGNGGSAAGGAAAACKKADLRVMLSVLGAPLAPVHASSLDPLPLLSIKDTPIETSSAQYILQQYMAASGAQTVQNSVRSAYAMGKVKMTMSEFETAAKVVKNRNSAQMGRFVLWQMNPDMWYVELAVGGSKVHAGCNGKLVWRHTPWLGAHTAKGPVRPLRRMLQGLDPIMTGSLFSEAKCIGEKKHHGEDCFILKVSTDPRTLKARSEGPVEIIRHVLFGYFSQKTGLLVYIEDSHLTRIQGSSGDAVYWETTFNSYLHDYRPVEGIMIAHSGHSVVTVFRFGETAMSHTKTRMEESWVIEEVAFNVPGLSEDCFIPPADLRSGSVTEALGLLQDERSKGNTSNRTKVVALEETRGGSIDHLMWRMEV
ncbi:hypothetical protein MLD38_032130 [Melastoma candidum]|uniref:Uncharacterized protein n=1 Tax=Melastoma candidum TaxID=119954 RepID=A0ACB9M3C1_9MYRT|nr:hypothetical protein MLD38_032130 [Melastoma candidum]